MGMEGNQRTAVNGCCLATLLVFFFPVQHYCRNKRNKTPLPVCVQKSERPHVSLAGYPFHPPPKWAITSAPREATALVAKERRKNAGNTDKSSPPTVRFSLLSSTGTRHNHSQREREERDVSLERKREVGRGTVLTIGGEGGEGAVIY